MVCDFTCHLSCLVSGSWLASPPEPSLLPLSIFSLAFLLSLILPWYRPNQFYYQLMRVMHICSIQKDHRTTVVTCLLTLILHQDATVVTCLLISILYISYLAHHSDIIPDGNKLREEFNCDSQF